MHVKNSHHFTKWFTLKVSQIYLLQNIKCLLEMFETAFHVIPQDVGY